MGQKGAKQSSPDGVLTEFPANDIDGAPVDMARFKGQVTLITNVASK